MKSADTLVARLEELHARTRETPLFNPVFQLSLDLSRQLEAGDLSLDAVESLIEELEARSLTARARRLRALVMQPAATTSPPTDAFEALRRRVETPALHAVFTAHPTFLLTPPQTEAVADAAVSGDPVQPPAPSERPAITLAYEHGRAMAAMARAQDARSKEVRATLERAARSFPDQWRVLRPLPLRLAHWVGYDMDGRTDIAWYHSIGFRLSEKAMRLRRYAGSLETVDESHPLIETLRSAATYAEARAEDFAGDLSAPTALSAAANRLSNDHPDKLVSLRAIIDRIESEARDAEEGRALALLEIACAMRADGLGMGGIHFRVNASQLHNAIRRRIDPDNTLDLASQRAMGVLRDLLVEVRPLRSNFGALAIESSSAIRQFLVMAQILDHVDADAPIRMLIAECEQPSTVLAALYFARLFGIDDKVDVSPLFETETALEHGGRFLDALLAEPVYQSYARLRGRVCIQTGFSDAGRFVGQIPASLAIERLQGRMAGAMAANGLSDVAALVFNTHGESMGRGAHPASFGDRLTWPMSDWARARFAECDIALEAEASFQGGDGYLFFANATLAEATVARILEMADHEVAPALDDPFYRRTDLSLDFYRAVRTQQATMRESRTYARAVTAFGLGLLQSTGSRVARRQGDLSRDRDLNLRQIRAIPHNAILQQLGYPVNVIAGIGSAADGRAEEIAHLLGSSARGRQILRLLRASNALASIKTVAAYGELFNSAYWASRPYRGEENHLAPASEALAAHLIDDDRNGVFRRLASRLRVDALKLHRLLALTQNENPLPDREETRRVIGALQALRLALLQHIFLKAVSIPAFSRANDIDRTDVLEMVLSLRVDEAVAQMRRAYPTSFPRIDDFTLDAPSDYPDGENEGYTLIGRDYIDPIERAYGQILRIGGAIANMFGAHG